MRDNTSIVLLAKVSVIASAAVVAYAIWLMLAAPSMTAPSRVRLLLSCASALLVLATWCAVIARVREWSGDPSKKTRRNVAIACVTFITIVLSLQLGALAFAS